MVQAAQKVNVQELKILGLRISETALTAEISDGRVISIPTSWFSRLSNASIEKLEKFEISPAGYGIYWPELDEDISIQSFINP